MKSVAGKVAMTLVALLGVSSVASAGQSLYLDGTFNSTNIRFTVGSNTYTEGGGGTIGATLDGNPISPVYCLEWNVDVQVPGTYNDTLVTTNGTLGSGHTALMNANKIAWLMLNVASGVTNATDQAGLQALIWDLNTSNFTLDTAYNAGITNAYNTYSALLAGASPSQLNAALASGYVLFLSPQKKHDNGINQALVSVTATPEPGTLALAVICLGSLGAVRVYRRRSGA